MRPVRAPGTALHPYVRVALFIIGYFLVAILISVILAAVAGVLAAAGTVKMPEIDEQLLAHGMEGLIAVLSRFMLPIAVATGVYSILYTWAFARLVDRKSLGGLGLRLRPGWLRGFAAGAGIAFLILLVIFLVSLATGAVRFEGFTRPAPESTSVIAYLLGAILAFFLVGLYEELMFRGYVLQTLTERGGQTGAMAASSILFALLHGANPGANALAILNTVVIGLLLAVFYFRTGSLWMPIGFHFAWNFSLGYIFTLPVSGFPIHGILKVVETGTEAGEQAAPYGPESYVATTLVVIALVVWLILRRPATRSRP